MTGTLGLRGHAKDIATMRTVQSVPTIAAFRLAVASALLLAMTSGGLAQQMPPALSQKSPEAAEILSRAQRDGNVRVVVMFDSPVHPSQISPEPSSIAGLKTRVAALRDAVVARHFGSVASPRPGQGFARALTSFEITPGFATNVTQAELAALAQDPGVVSIQYDRPVPPTLIDSVPLIGMSGAYALGATGAGY